MTPATNFDTLPLVLTVDEMLAIYRFGRSTFLREVANGTFHPAPFQRDPYRWRREDVERDFRRQPRSKAAPAPRTARGRKPRRR